MDISLAQTFLAIVETGSFLAAGERLHVTQSTVSTRVQSLEALLGQALFTRGRHGAQLTEAGNRFRGYAEGMVRMWEQARQELALPEQFSSSVAVGGQVSLWDRLLPQWLRWMRLRAPNIAVRVEVGSSEQIVRQIAEGLVALGVVYTPVTRTGLAVEPLFEDHLLLVKSGPSTAKPTADDYVYVDWGPDFQADHAAAWPGSEMPAIFVQVGLLGLQHILDNGGSGYFPERMLQRPLADGRLVRVDDAPVFERPVYLVRDETRKDEAARLACEGLRSAVVNMLDGH